MVRTICDFPNGDTILPVGNYSWNLMKFITYSLVDIKKNTVPYFFPCWFFRALSSAKWWCLNKSSLYGCNQRQRVCRSHVLGGDLRHAQTPWLAFWKESCLTWGITCVLNMIIESGLAKWLFACLCPMCYPKHIYIDLYNMSFFWSICMYSCLDDLHIHIILCE